MFFNWFCLSLNAKIINRFFALLPSLSALNIIGVKYHCVIQPTNAPVSVKFSQSIYAVIDIRLKRFGQFHILF